MITAIAVITAWVVGAIFANMASIARFLTDERETQVQDRTGRPRLDRA